MKTSFDGIATAARFHSEWCMFLSSTSPPPTPPPVSFFQVIVPDDWSPRMASPCDGFDTDGSTDDAAVDGEGDDCAVVPSPGRTRPIPPGVPGCGWVVGGRVDALVRGRRQMAGVCACGWRGGGPGYQLDGMVENRFKGGVVREGTPPHPPFRGCLDNPPTHPSWLGMGRALSKGSKLLCA